MSYAGQTYRMNFRGGGLFYNANIDDISPESMLICRNINFDEGGRGNRGGTAKINGTAVSGSPRIMGLADFQLPSSSFQVFGANDGKVYKTSTATIKTGMSTTNKFNFEKFASELYICDGFTTPQTWDGAAAGTNNITTPAADWTGTTQPFQMLAHGRAASRRLFALMGSTLYHSSLNNGKVFSGGTSGFIPIYSADAQGLVGAAEFGDRIILFTRTQAFIIDDTDASPNNWGYAQAQWTGGVAHWRLIVKTPNDLFCMTETGVVYSLSAVQSYGDYRLADVTKPAFMDRWIAENVSLSSIDDFHGNYDPIKRCVRFYVVRTGQTNVDTCLKYFIDRPPEQAWAVDDNQSLASGMGASCSAVARSSTGVYQFWTGDYSGFLWKNETAARNDDGGAYTATFRTPSLSIDDSRTNKLFKRGFLTTRPDANINISVKVWVDGEYKDTKIVALSGAGNTFGTGLYGTAIFGGNSLYEAPFELGYIGKRIQFEIFNSNANEKFFVSGLLLDFKPLGRKPA